MFRTRNPAFTSFCMPTPGCAKLPLEYVYPKSASFPCFFPSINLHSYYSFLDDNLGYHHSRPLHMSIPEAAPWQTVRCTSSPLEAPRPGTAPGSCSLEIDITYIYIYMYIIYIDIYIYIYIIYIYIYSVYIVYGTRTICRSWFRRCFQGFLQIYKYYIYIHNM